MNRSEIQTRIAELDRQINSEVAGSKLPSSGPRRQFPMFFWVLAGAAFGWYYYGAQIPGAQEIHSQYAIHGFYAGAVVAALAAWGTVLYFFQPSGKISPEYRESTQRVRALQEERRELMVRLRELEQ